MDGCAEGLVCEYAANACATPSASGTCVVAEGCDAGVPYCGCDQIVYPTACAAREAGVGVTDAAHCSVSTFACGDKTCAAFVELCSKYVEPPDDLEEYECVAVDASRCIGGIAGCECLGFPAGHVGGQTCSVSAEGHVTIVTQGI